MDFAKNLVVFEVGWISFGGTRGVGGFKVGLIVDLRVGSW